MILGKFFLLKNMTRRQLTLTPIQSSSDRLAATLMVERWNSFAVLGNEWAGKTNEGKLDARLWKRLRSKAAELFDLEFPRNERASSDYALYMRTVERVNARRTPTPKGG